MWHTPQACTRTSASPGPGVGHQHGLDPHRLALGETDDSAHLVSHGAIMLDARAADNEGGLSHFAARLPVQERLTKQIAGWLDTQLAPKGVGVAIEAEHTCMTLRGVRAAGTSTVTSTLLGTLREDPRSRQEFFALTGRST